MNRPSKLSKVPLSPLPLSPAVPLDPLSCTASPVAPAPTLRLMPVPDDVADGVFRGYPPVNTLVSVCLAGGVSSGDPVDVLSGHPSSLAMAQGETLSPMDYAAVHAAQVSPSPLPAVFSAQLPVPVSPFNGAADEHDVAQPGAIRDSYADRLHCPAGLYNQPVYGVLLPDTVAQTLAYRSPGAYSISDGDVMTERGERLTREGFPTLLPVVNRAPPGTPTTPGAARLSEMSISGGGGSLDDGGLATPGLDMLADAAALLANAHYRLDGDEEMDYDDGEVTASRSVSPVPGGAKAGSLTEQDHPVPGIAMGPGEFLCQQQELIRLQLEHDELRARPAIVRNPTAQFYSRTPRPGPTIDPVLLRGYAPMEVDGFPARREPLAHARVDGSVSSDQDLYAPPPLLENLRDDPPDAPRVPHLYEGVELPGLALRSGKVRYSHDVPIRNSAAISAAVQGASGDIPQMWGCGDHVFDARLLAGGAAAPPQNVVLPPVATPLSFTIIPVAGVPALHYDDPEIHIKGLASERVFVIFRQPQATAVLVKIYNGGVPRASNVKAQSDALGEGVSAACGAKDFIIVPPAQAWGQELTLQDQPTTWVVLRLQPEHVRALVSQLVWSSKKITFLAFNRDMKFDRFIGRVGYYTHNFDNDIDTSIRRTFAGPLVLPGIRSLVAALPSIRPEDVDPTVARVLASIHVRVQTYPNGNIIANIYCDSPTDSVEAWRGWIDYIHTVPFWSDLNPTGTFLCPVRCAGCFAADHPTFMCPLAELPGWNGPPPGAASIEGPTTPPGLSPPARGFQSRGDRPYRGGPTRAYRGRGRGNGTPY
ncbi:hypothetical protein C8T65DRAFT_692695 [Cerioporus squamosus]|nr:hypothetical protein C8T65DRAFT_692695 [Cerioporus squamosus]